jgi:hypothetical protein
VEAQQQSTYIDYPNAEEEQKKCMAFLHDYMDGDGIPKYYDMHKSNWPQRGHFQT